MVDTRVDYYGTRGRVGKESIDDNNDENTRRSTPLYSGKDSTAQYSALPRIHVQVCVRYHAEDIEIWDLDYEYCRAQLLLDYEYSFFTSNAEKHGAWKCRRLSLTDVMPW